LRFCAPFCGYFFRLFFFAVFAAALFMVI
jgi:hypothetical protein